MKWSVILLLSVPTSISGIFRFRCTSLLISPIGGRSWLYKLLYKCMKCGYEKEQIWYEKLSWGMKLHRHINSDIQKRSKHYFQIKSPLDKGCYMRVVRKNTKNTYLWTRCPAPISTVEIHTHMVNELPTYYGLCLCFCLCKYPGSWSD